MQKLITGLAAAAALALLVSAGYADCGFHNTKQVTASTQKAEEGVAMSTYDGKAAPTIAKKTAAECPEGATDCVPAAE
jgi:hypothetical protein